MISSTILAFSGIDGAGKTTTARRTARRVDGLYRKQVHGFNFERLTATLRTPHRPGDYGQDFAQAYCTDFIAYAKRIRPRTSPDRPILYDRWKTCVRAFAHSFGNDPAAIDERLRDIPDPDIDFVLDTPVDIALQRLRKRGELDPDETEEVLSRLRVSYLRLAAETKQIVLIDSTSPIPMVLRQVTSHLHSLFSLTAMEAS